jgi:hypothetical protein
VIALLLGTLLTLGALALVLYPLFVEPDAPTGPAPRSNHVERTAGQRALDALREVEFDRATGKLSTEDYEELKAAYTSEAVQAMRAEEAMAADVSLTSGVSDDEIEAEIRRYAGGTAAVPCATCGPRPEAGASWCSECGSCLAGACPHCGAAIPESGARFCSNCGETLADASRAGAAPGGVPAL